MQAYFFVAPPSIDRSACSNQNISVGPWVRWSKQRGALRCRSKVSASAISGNQQNHYSVLGVPNNASSSDIKKAYRLLALKYHPDVSKDSGADEVFKKIRLAYEVLSDESTRNQYDNALRRQDYNTGPLGGDWEYNFEYYNGGRTYKWADSKRSRRRQRYWEEYHTRENFYENDDELEKEIPDEEERGPFAEVLRSSFISLFLMYTVGMRWSLTFSSLMAFFDRKLDAGYKTGYLLAWILGGTGGILLTLCLSFTSWLFGKTNSSVVSLVVIATWIGCNAPIPQGAILTLLYMSIKLQGDLG